MERSISVSGDVVSVVVITVSSGAAIVIDLERERVSPHGERRKTAAKKKKKKKLLSQFQVPQNFTIRERERERERDSDLRIDLRKTFLVSESDSGGD